MKIPKNLKIGGHDFKIILKPFWVGGDDALALCDRDKNEIWIRATLSDSQLEAALFHEIFHGLNTVLDHELLDSLSEQFYQVLKDNRMLR